MVAGVVGSYRARGGGGVCDAPSTPPPPTDNAPIAAAACARYAAAVGMDDAAAAAICIGDAAAVVTSMAEATATPGVCVWAPDPGTVYGGDVEAVLVCGGDVEVPAVAVAGSEVEVAVAAVDVYVYGTAATLACVPCVAVTVGRRRGMTAMGWGRTAKDFLNRLNEHQLSWLPRVLCRIQQPACHRGVHTGHALRRVGR